MSNHPLKTYREAAGVTLETLAARAGCTKATLSKIERGQRLPSLGLATRLQHATDGAVTPNDFIEPAAAGS